MIIWNAYPLEGVNDIKFGMGRTEVRGLLGNCKEFKKTSFSKTTSDDFGICHVYYNDADECEAIEIFKDVEVFVDGKLIFPTSIDSVRLLVPDLVEDDGSYISESQSIGIYAPDGDVESILFGKKDYYK